MTATGLIPRKRLERIPHEMRLAHEYCFFLHDQCVHLLVQYEAAEAHHVKVKFRSKVEAATFAEVAKTDSIEALRATGYPVQARRVILNTITMAMVSDTLHHIFEALKCMEKRKTVVALNLLRKPLLDSLVYLSWMLGDEDAFYTAFTSGDPAALSPKMLGNLRARIIEQALAKTEVATVLNADFLRETLFSAKNDYGLYRLFQHAVHLVTVERIELRTEPENFNFIFKRHSDDDIYHAVYEVLPHLLLYLAHVMLELFERIASMDEGAKRAFQVRSIFGLSLLEGGEGAEDVTTRLGTLQANFTCTDCGTALTVTPHNASRIILTESYRCPKCRRVHGFPFAWMF